MNLHFRVESAFEELIDALHMAEDHAESGKEQDIYHDLAEEVIGARGKAQDALLLYLVKKNAAPAAGTTETAKDSGKESNFSLDENPEDVKNSRLILNVIDDEKIEAEVSIHGPSEHLLRLHSAAVETIVFTAPDLCLDPEDLMKAHQQGVDGAMDRLTKKAIKIVSEASSSKRERLLHFSREVNAPEDLIQKIFGGAEK